ncbi:MAG: RNA-binding protein [Clostridiales bacterium]|nr:RNA-binding protein [Clostridiales bacterium]
MNLNSYGFQLSGEDKILLRSVEDKINQSQKYFKPKFTFFLDERQCWLVKSVLDKSNFKDYFIYGGFDNAKRNMLAIAPLYSYVDFPVFPIVTLNFTFRKIDVLTHRDFLGSLMSLNIERKTIGDIIVGDGSAFVFACETVAETIYTNIKKIGKIGVEIFSDKPLDILVKQEFEEIKGTVASLRLDNIVSLALNISREKSALLVKNKGVAVNFETLYSVNHIMNENDTFSIKGFGKFVLSTVNGVSKKGRIHITIFKFI